MQEKKIGIKRIVFANVSGFLVYTDSVAMMVDTGHKGMSGRIFKALEELGVDIVEAMEMDIPLIGSCLKLYYHFYTLEYPVLFMLTDNKDSAKHFELQGGERKSHSVFLAFGDPESESNIHSFLFNSCSQSPDSTRY